MVDVRPLDNLGLKSLEVCHLDPYVGSLAARPLDTLGVTKQQAVLAIVTVKTGERHVTMLGLGGQRTVVVKSQRHANLGTLASNGARPRAAVLEQLTVGLIGMANGPVSKEGAVLAHVGCLDHQRGDGTVNVSLAGDGDALLVEDGVGGTRHDAQLVLQLVPALDAAGGAVVLPDHAAHGNRHGGNSTYLLVCAVTVVVLLNPGKLLLKLGAAIACLLSLGNLDAARQLGKRHRDDLDVEFLDELALVVHGGVELVRTRANLQNARCAEGLDHVADSQEVAQATLKDGIVHAAVGHVSEGHLETAQHLAGSEEAALGVAQAGSVRLGALVKRAPQKHRLTQVLGKARTDELRAKVAVRQEEAVNAFCTELLQNLNAVVLVKEQTFVVDVIDINELDAQLAELVGNDATVLACVRSTEDAASCGCVTNLDGVHEPSPSYGFSLHPTIRLLVPFSRS